MLKDQQKVSIHYQCTRIIWVNICSYLISLGCICIVKQVIIIFFNTRRHRKWNKWKIILKNKLTPKYEFALPQFYKTRHFKSIAIGLSMHHALCDVRCQSSVNNFTIFTSF